MDNDTTTLTLKPICDKCGYVLDNLIIRKESVEIREGKDNHIKAVSQDTIIEPAKCENCNRIITSASFINPMEKG